MANEYSKKTNADLIEILKSRSLPYTGKKADLIARLQEADKAQANKSNTNTVPAADPEDVIDWDDEPAETLAAAPAGKGAATNPVAVPNQKVDTDPSTTHDLKVIKPEDKKAETTNEAAATDSSAKADKAAINGAQAKEKPAADTPAVDYSMGLATTDLDAELAKRKARAAKFGVVDDPVVTEAQKAIERAKRFGNPEDTTTGEPKVKGLDQALPSERPRKRGRGGDDGDSYRGKRRNFGGRGRRDNRDNRDNRGRRDRNGGNNNEAKPRMNEADRAALEKRKQRFAQA
ncbi:hypothetical protein FQN57_006861 [Myotisia sp. PD_48]|nr:hypothetical protein FQN57_006861 [Myotisia sp. PD_48]